jgi:hypothetical protein
MYIYESSIYSIALRKKVENFIITTCERHATTKGLHIFIIVTGREENIIVSEWEQSHQSHAELSTENCYSSVKTISFCHLICKLFGLKS